MLDIKTFPNKPIKELFPALLLSQGLFQKWWSAALKSFAAMHVPLLVVKQQLHITLIVVLRLSAFLFISFLISENSGSFRRTSRQTDIWAITCIYLTPCTHHHSSAELHELVTQDSLPYFFSFFFIFDFACARLLVFKSRVILGTGLDVLVGEEARTAPFLKFVSQG